jgi:lysophospholipid acyltransferase (LPLAT)-like uncharacterized protein
LSKIKYFIGNSLLPFFINLYLKTLRISIKNFHNEDGIYIFWHSKMLAGWYLFRNIKAASLVSQSKDGEVLAKILDKWDYKVIRGSSSRGGKESLIELISALNDGSKAVVTPDGPRGPMKEIKNGVLKLSFETGKPIIPVKITYKSKFILDKSWDKFEIPYPFSKCEAEFGKNFYYTEYKYDNDLDNFKKEISNYL